MSRKTQTNIRPALQERSREKRDRLINVGLVVFSQRGYAQTRMADVAAEAGVSVGVLYQRFKNSAPSLKSLSIPSQNDWNGA